MASGVGTPPRGARATPKRVVRTGLALVHENEIVYPAAGSEAQARRVIDDANADIHFHFPVVIEVVSATSAGQTHATVEAAMDRQQRELARRLSRR